MTFYLCLATPLREERSSFSARIRRYRSPILVQLHDRSNDWYAAYRVCAKATSCLLVPDVDNEMLYIAGEMPTCTFVYVRLNNDDSSRMYVYMCINDGGIYVPDSPRFTAQEMRRIKFMFI